MYVKGLTKTNGISHNDPTEGGCRKYKKIDIALPNPLPSSVKGRPAAAENSMCGVLRRQVRNSSGATIIASQPCDVSAPAPGPAMGVMDGAMAMAPMAMAPAQAMPMAAGPAMPMST